MIEIESNSMFTVTSTWCVQYERFIDLFYEAVDAMSTEEYGSLMRIWQRNLPITIERTNDWVFSLEQNIARWNAQRTKLRIWAVVFDKMPHHVATVFLLREFTSISGRRHYITGR